MSDKEHKAKAPAAVRVFVLTVSDTRTDQTDTGGAAIVQLLTEAGHTVTARVIVKDDPKAVAGRIKEQVLSGAVDAVITTGGTGITKRDSTFEAIDALLDKRLPGFGELFRMLSYHEIGSAAMMSRACAGTIGAVIVIALPGSESAVRLAMTRLVVPELGHMVQQVRK